MSELVVFGFLALSILAYGVTGGADFGVGILESLAPRAERSRIRSLGEHAIAPVWEANHIWLIIALVICFVGYPGVHVYLTTFLHVPLLVMLIGIILRGTAFTFRYYDVGEQPAGGGPWTPLFRAGSLMVPFAFGVIAAALRGGRMPATPSTVWETYFTPWLAPFPLATGLFAVTICAWLAAVFLVGECTPEEHASWARRARAATFAMVLAGALATAAGLSGPASSSLGVLGHPVALASTVAATLALFPMWLLLGGARFWTQRLLAGTILGAVLLGYFGVDTGLAVLLDDGTQLRWDAEAAPEATLEALATALVVAALCVLPGLVWLYRLFKQPRTA